VRAVAGGHSRARARHGQHTQRTHLGLEFGEQGGIFAQKGRGVFLALADRLAAALVPRPGLLDEARVDQMRDKPRPSGRRRIARTA